MLEHQKIERSIITKYRKDIWRKFVKAVTDYNLIEENDKIAVCISGGKDSFLLAKLLEELQKHGKKKFELIFLVMNPGYLDNNLKKIKENATKLNLKVEIFTSDIFEVVEKQNSSCYLCARMRRGFLYSKAQELGCNKIALGHHFDDVIETILLSILYGGEFKSMRPKLSSKNFNGMQLIRPMYLIREKDIISFSKYNNLNFINCGCKFVSLSNQKIDASKRLKVKKLIEQLEEENPLIASNIFASSRNVNLNTLLGYKLENKEYNFFE